MQVSLARPGAGFALRSWVFISVRGFPAEIKKAPQPRRLRCGFTYRVELITSHALFSQREKCLTEKGKARKAEKEIHWCWVWHGSASLSICMHFTLTKCSDSVKIKNLESWARLLPLYLAVYKLSKTKGSNYASEAGFCCLCRRPDETLQDQRQQPRLRKQDFAAFGLDGGLFMPGWPCKTEDFYNSFMDFCGILPNENYFFVLLRMNNKHKSACLCTVLVMYDQKYTKAPGIGNYYRIVTNF